MGRRPVISAPAELLPSLDFRIWHTSPISMGRAHAHPDIEINVILEGRMRYFLSGRFYDLRAGDIAAFWAGMPHQTLGKTNDLHGVWLTIPLPWLLRWKNASALASRLLAGGLVVYPSTPAAREAFAQWVRDFDTGTSALREIVVSEIECHLSRISLGLAPVGGRKSTPPPGMEKLTAVTAFLGRHYASPLTVATIAKAVGLHPKYLLTFFRRACGMTLWTYVTRLRLAHVQRLLLTTNRTVLDIALEAGFGSASAFYQAFQKYESRPPSRFRKNGSRPQ